MGAGDTQDDPSAAATIGVRGADAANIRAWSSFVDDWCNAHPDRLSELRDSGRLGASGKPNPAPAPDPAVTDDFDKALRAYRHESLAVIAWRDLAGLDALEATLAALTALAENCIEAALVAAEAEIATRHGVIRDADDNVVRLCVMGMGKLGGGELNFSSDIDLIFAYPHGGCGESDGQRPLAVVEYFRKLAQRLVRCLHAATSDGFVYRVDTRLRPFGDAGALVASFSAMEAYYQNHGREWERYAWIKARPVAGDIDAGQVLNKMLRPFVYRRYLDYGTFESIREMKALIDRQIQQARLASNIKLGRGGIREIEFMVQAFQLIRGGQEPELRDHRLLPAMAKLVEGNHLLAHQVEDLEAAYWLLRRVENRLQMVADQQTHDLPSESAAQARFAAMLGYTDWSSFVADLDATRNTVQAAFGQIFAGPQAGAGTAVDGREARLTAAWEASLDEADVYAVIGEYGVDDAESVYNAFADLRHRANRYDVEQRGHRWLTGLLPRLFEDAAASDNPDLALERALPVIGAIVGRSNYLALLVEHPAARSMLVRLCVGSAWIAGRIGEQPALLDNLLDPRQLFRLPARDALETELADEIAAVGDDLEQQMNVLRRFTQAAKLKIAAADVTEAVPLMTVSDRLSELAEVVLNQAVEMAWQQLAARHGIPRRDDNGRAGFGVIAYGRLGGLELGYTSDLDLVFVYDAPSERVSDGDRPLSAQVFFTRLAQRLIHILATQTPAGRAFEVDMRLRPSGRSGLMVSHIDAFATYQDKTAWTWEHQALVRARYVAGPEELGARFRAIRADVLGCQRDPVQLATQVRDMRRRMSEAKDQSTDDLADVKQMRGGLIDIEFMTQFAVLSRGHDCPEVLIFSDAIRILETLESAGLVSFEDTRILVEAYRDYRRRRHSQALQLERAMIPADALAERREAVAALWDQWLGEA
ncbi:bifunctional [glutamate--ammonia ligase]-adenylyl-L-tyrosine phosphorylase/[glutamate--ammonia-ligase] adenylyltransferase [Salinisphaera orenii]|uniref:bifunctional [glutamate--ammonia ligase]-adenylyl-L-tyrosine phosphorylase/[glutamate--ammonia-ligase] adenylyltransferase n=1 Tax=Salinisphaera orenii TaxID=856731 RepID=UPI0013A65D34